MRTKRQCQEIILSIAEKLGVSAKLIATKMLSSGDKQAMLSGELNYDDLESAVKVWAAFGMPDCSEK